MAFWESYSPDQVDEIKQESAKSELVTESTNGEEQNKIVNSTERGWDKVVDMDEARTQETEEHSEEEPGKTLEDINNDPKLAEKMADEAIKDGLPDAIQYLNEDEQNKFANSIEEWVAESGVDLPIDTIPENWWESLKNYAKVAKNRDSLSPDQKTALDNIEKAAVEDMTRETKEKVLSNLVEQSMWKEPRPERNTEEKPDSQPNSTQENPENAEWWSLN